MVKEKNSPPSYSQTMIKLDIERLLKKIWKEIKIYREEECSICLDREPTEIFLPCKHCVCCIKCKRFLKKCPHCNGDIEDCIYIDIYNEILSMFKYDKDNFINNINSSDYETFHSELVNINQIFGKTPKPSAPPREMTNTQRRRKKQENLQNINYNSMKSNFIILRLLYDIIKYGKPRYINLEKLKRYTLQTYLEKMGITLKNRTTKKNRKESVFKLLEDIKEQMK